MAPPQTLEQKLAERTTEGALGFLYKKLSDYRVQCFACANQCRIPEGKMGICKVRFNEGGALRVPWDYATVLEVDPMEKNPFSTPFPIPLPFPSGCWAATTTVPTAKTGSPARP